MRGPPQADELKLKAEGESLGGLQLITSYLKHSISHMHQGLPSLSTA